MSQVRLPTVKKLFALSGNCCAFPDCTRSLFENDTVVTEICHIAAARPGEARYDKTQTDEERHGFDNLILLCPTHHTTIDGDETKYTTPIIKKWKADREKAGFASNAAGLPNGLPPQSIAEIVKQLVETLAVAPEPDIEEIYASARKEADADAETFRRMSGWPAHAVELDLSLTGDTNKGAFRAAGLATAMDGHNQIAVIAPPGTGKTTTLIQITSAIIDHGNAIAIFVPLNEWSANSGTLFEAIVRRASYKKTGVSELSVLASEGKLVLVLDGWNELDSKERREATSELRQLTRDFPDIGLVLSTRRQALYLPISGPVIQIGSLTFDQQVEIARALKGSDGVALVDHARRTPGVRDLVSIPLYLTALLSRTSGARLPTTKEEVLRIFVEEQEQSAEKAEVLKGVFPRELLGSVAVTANFSSNTVVSQSQVRSVLSEATAGLVKNGQLTIPIQPDTLLDVLVDHHILVRHGEKRELISFQHQQFQEYYASFEVEQKMIATAKGDDAAKQMLRTAMLNDRYWEESVLFACERGSRTTSADAVASTILLALEIDPMLAAEMIYRSDPSVWSKVGQAVLKFALVWHVPGKVDRAFRFMMITGREEFADYIWPLLLDPNNQKHIRALRAAPRIRPGVLGRDAGARLQSASKEIREVVLGELAARGDIQAMELAVTITKTDNSDEVILSVLESLAFRRAEALAIELLDASGAAVWSKFAAKGYSEEIADPKTKERLVTERNKLIQAESHPLKRLWSLIDAKADSAQIEKLIASEEFKAADANQSHSFIRAIRTYPEAVSKAMVSRLNEGRDMPWDAEELLSLQPTTDKGPLVELALNIDTDRKIGNCAALMVGPNAVGQLISNALKAHNAAENKPWAEREPLHDQYRIWRDRVVSTRQSSLVQAVLDNWQEAAPDDIGEVAGMVGSQGDFGDREEPFRVTPDQMEAFAKLLERWAERLIADKQSSRGAMANVAIVIGRTALPALLNVLQRMLDEDLNRRRGGSDPAMVWTNWYQKAFVSIGTDEAATILKSYLKDKDFGREAAVGLKQIFDKKEGRQPPSGTLVKSWPDFSTVGEARALRAKGKAEESACAASILTAIEELIATGSDEAYRQATELAVVVLGVPRRSGDELIQSVADLPLPILSKQTLFAAMILDGFALPASVVNSAIDAWFEEATKKTWMLIERNWQIEGLIQFLAFTDDPEAAVAAVTRANAGKKFPERFEKVVVALSNSPAERAENALVAMLRENPKIVSEQEWLRALLRRNTGTGIWALFDAVENGSLPKASSSESYWISEQVAERFKQDESLFEQARVRYRGDGSSADRLLELCLSKSGRPECITAIINSYVKRGQPLDGLLESAVREIAVTREPSEAWSGAYEIQPAALTELRKNLFDMFMSDQMARDLAKRCLEIIDRVRDEYGAPDIEPRHPDIADGRPWPVVA